MVTVWILVELDGEVFETKQMVAPANLGDSQVDAAKKAFHKVSDDTLAWLNARIPKDQD